MSTAKPLTYADRAERYLARPMERYDPHRMSIDKMTPAQRHRALHKERHAWPLEARRG